MTMSQIDVLQDQLNIRFSNPDLLAEALTHSSYSRGAKGKLVPDNERLEFLGDAVLKLCISQYLYEKYSDFDEGRLTKMRARMVADRTLAQVSRKLKLGHFMRFSYGEQQSGGADRDSNLANAFEAVLGAIFLDQGFEAVKTFLLDLVASHNIEEISADRVVDYKTVLQEALHKKKWPLPVYTLVKEEGPDHQKTFFVEGSVARPDGPMSYVGTGSTKKQAEQKSAKGLLSKLGHSESDR